MVSIMVLFSSFISVMQLVITFCYVTWYNRLTVAHRALCKNQNNSMVTKRSSKVSRPLIRTPYVTELRPIWQNPAYIWCICRYNCCLSEFVWRSDPDSHIVLSIENTLASPSAPHLFAQCERALGCGRPAKTRWPVTCKTQSKGLQRFP